MKTSPLVAALLVSGTTANYTPTGPTKIEQIVGGMLKGALDAEGFNDIIKCVGDGEQVFEDAYTAIQDFEKKDTEDVIAGLEEVGKMLLVVKKGMSDCSSIKADWKKLEAMAVIFANPTSLAYHVGKDLLVNGRDIFHEVDTSITDYKAQNW